MKNMMSAGNISSSGSGVTKIETIGPKQESANYGPWAKSGPQPVLTNTFYWKAVMLICLQIISGCIHDSRVEQFW